LLIDIDNRNLIDSIRMYGDFRIEIGADRFDMYK
jgi:hypothetical protein